MLRAEIIDPLIAAYEGRLAEALAALEPALGDSQRATLIADYFAPRLHLAFAFASVAKSHWWTADWPGG